MTQDEIMFMAMKSGCPKENALANMDILETFAKLVAQHEREVCLGVIEAHQIPVGNSAAGEMACEWTYDALKEIATNIRARGQA
jgi:hypothetical protein